MSYAIIVTSAEVKPAIHRGSVMTKEGTRFIVTDDREGWVEATSRRFRGTFPPDTKVFKSYDEAVEFGYRWGGHPWWCKPALFEVAEVYPVFKPVITGYEEVK